MLDTGFSLLGTGCSIPNKEKRQLPVKKLPFLPVLVLLSLLLNSLFLPRETFFYFTGAIFIIFTPPVQLNPVLLLFNRGEICGNNKVHFTGVPKIQYKVFHQTINILQIAQ
ncbi:MAG: hypothetical protein JRC89_12790 [Deltaproteobacteria bacterium]|nr:hypothetical protein [Deltaproteobacteria bacterium]